MASPPFRLIILLYYSAGLAFVKRLYKMRYIGNTPILPKSGKIRGNVTIKSHQYGL